MRAGVSSTKDRRLAGEEKIHFGSWVVTREPSRRGRTWVGKHYGLVGYGDPRSAVKSDILWINAEFNSWGCETNTLQAMPRVEGIFTDPRPRTLRLLLGSG